MIATWFVTVLWACRSQSGAMAAAPNISIELQRMNVLRLTRETLDSLPDILPDAFQTDLLRDGASTACWQHVSQKTSRSGVEYADPQNSGHSRDIASRVIEEIRHVSIANERPRTCCGSK
jgi:hypothetical protein